MPNVWVIQYQMECGHIQFTRELPGEWMICDKCAREVHLFAIETREWHVRCMYEGCKFGRWCGAAKDLTHVAESGHGRRNPAHEKYMVDYLQHPGKADVVRSVFGRHVHRNILDSRRLPVTPRSRALPVPDIPPF